MLLTRTATADAAAAATNRHQGNRVWRKADKLYHRTYRRLCRTSHPQARADLYRLMADACGDQALVAGLTIHSGQAVARRVEESMWLTLADAETLRALYAHRPVHVITRAAPRHLDADYLLRRHGDALDAVTSGNDRVEAYRQLAHGLCGDELTNHAAFTAAYAAWSSLATATRKEVHHR